MGRKPLYGKAMTASERQQRKRAKKKTPLHRGTARVIDALMLKFSTPRNDLTSEEITDMNKFVVDLADTIKIEVQHAIDRSPKGRKYCIMVN